MSLGASCSGPGGELIAKETQDGRVGHKAHI